MMLDAYQHILGTCYRNYHGQNDFIYDFTASQTLEGQVSSICHHICMYYIFTVNYTNIFLLLVSRDNYRWSKDACLLFLHVVLLSRLKAD